MKKLFGICTALAVALCFICANVSADENNVSMYINDSAVQSSVPAVVVGGVTLVPARIVSEALGCSVDWNEADRSVAISNDIIWFAMTVGSNEAFDAAGNRFELPAAPFLQENTMMIPVRFVSEQMGLSVKWEEETSTVFINSDSTFAGFMNSSSYYLVLFNKKLSNIKYLNQTGSYYEAAAVIATVTDQEIQAAKDLASGELAEFYVEKEDTEKNINLMAVGQPNEIEAQLNLTYAYLQNAASLYNQGLYYEAADALKDFYTYRTTPTLVSMYNELIQCIQQQIDYLPYRTLKEVKKLYDNGDFYGAYSKLQAFMTQRAWSGDILKTSNELKAMIEKRIQIYEQTS